MSTGKNFARKRTAPVQNNVQSKNARRTLVFNRSINQSSNHDSVISNESPRKRSSDSTPQPAKKFIPSLSRDSALPSSDEDDEDDDCDDNENDFSNSMLKALSVRKSVIAGEENVGIIEKVVLKNFMCHSNLEFKFHPNVNFIVGNNGSGKSAVLNGIMLALGCRAYSTGRSQNLAGFIQTGKNIAYMTVTLRNKGLDAYQPDDFGPSITVERTICKDGRGQYKIKGAGGRLISNKKDELMNILEALNIQVDNPVSVLTQEASKCFLDSKDPKKKYELYFKATQLEKLHTQYSEVDKKQEQAHAILQNKKEVLPEAEKDLRKWAKKLKLIQSADVNQNQIKLLKDKAAWAVVKQEEGEVAKAEEVVKTYEKEVEICERKIFEHDRAIDKINAQAKELKGKETQLSEDAHQLQATSNNRKKVVLELTSEINQLKCNIESLDRELKVNRKDVQELETKIKEIERQSIQDRDAEKKRREEEKALLIKKEKSLFEHYSNLQQSINEGRECASKVEEKLSVQSQTLAHLSNLKQRKENEINTMKCSISNQELLFGRNIPTLRRKIEEAHRRGLFKCKPIGPIGLFVQIKEPKWSWAIERCLAQTLLQSFCCDNLHDCMKLKTIFHEVYGNERFPSIIISRFINQVHNVQPYKVQYENYETVYDCINCDNPVVFNCLIDQKAIESILLIETADTAIRIMGTSPPKNCLYSFTKDGDQVYPLPNHRFYSCKANPSSQPLLQRYKADEIKKCEEQLIEISSNISKALDEKKELTKLLYDYRTRIQDLDREYKAVRKDMMTITGKIKDLSSNTDDQISVTALNEDLTKAMADIEENESKKRKVIAEYKLKKSELDEAKQKMKDGENSLMENKNMLHQVKVDIDENAHRKRLLLNKKEDFINKMRELKSRQKEAESTFSTLNQQLKKSIALANQRCARVDSRDPVAKINSQIEELEAAVKESASGLDREEVERNFYERRDAFERSKHDIEYLEKYVNKLKSTMVKRHTKYMEIRDLSSLRVKYMFLSNLQTRHFTGKLTFDHEKGTLEIFANPPDSKTSRFHKTQNLSGGERSFVTVALLMCLSDASEMPFHILDEYDVFMDTKNRDNSLRIMMEKAAEDTNKQYLFLSPLDLPPSAYQWKNLVRIHRMPDPVRHKPNTS